MTSINQYIEDIEQEISQALERVSQEFGSNVRIERIGQALNDIRIEIAVNAEEPTTASAQVGQLDLPSVTIQIDPEGISSVFPAAMQQLMSINSLMSSTTQSSRNEVIYNSLINAIRILIDRYSYEQVIAEFNVALANNGIARVSDNFRDIVKNSLSQILKDLSEYGPDNIPVPEYELITEGDLTPVPDNLVTIIPDLYVQRYRKYSEDPYKGYEEWFSKTTGDTVYLARDIGSYYFESMQEEINGSSEISLADSLDPYIEDEELVLTVKILNELLEDQEIKIKNTSMEKAAGKGSSVNILGLLKQLLPHISVTIDIQRQEQTPNSVLNIGAINEALDEFSENMATLGSLNQMIDEALQLPTALQDLVDLNLSNAVSQIQSAVGEINDFTSRATQVLDEATALIDNINGVRFTINVN